MNLDDLPDLLLPREVAALLRVATPTVNGYVRSGKLAATRTLGRHQRIRKASLIALLEADPHEMFNCPKFGPACGRCSREAGEPVAWPCGVDQ